MTDLDLANLTQKIEEVFKEISELKTRYSYEIGMEHKKGKLKEDIDKLYNDILHIRQIFDGERGLFVKMSKIDDRINRIEGIIKSITYITTTTVMLVIGLLIKAVWELITVGNGAL